MSTNDLEFLHPNNWIVSKGYTNGIAAEGRQVFIAGQVGWNACAKFESADFVAQVEQALSNVMQILTKAGGKPSHLVVKIIRLSPAIMPTLCGVMPILRAVLC